MNTKEEIRRMTLRGLGPSAITKRLNAAGLTNTQGREWSVQRVQQIVTRHFPDRGSVREFSRCRRGFVLSLEALKEAAQTDAEAASVHAVYLKERKGGADVLAAAERALAVA